MDKSQIIEAMKAVLRKNLEGALAEAKSAKDAATSEESKAENKYDTRGLEASYIAQAQSARIEKIKEDMFNLSKVDLSPKDSVQVGSLVLVHYAKKDIFKNYFILPVGGLNVELSGSDVQSLSVTSPLGKMLFRKEIDEELIFRHEDLVITEIS